MMRVLIIPDVHGLSFWKEPVNRYINEVDRVVFLGDYLDPYPDKGESVDTDDIFGNLVEIVNVKLKHKEKVVLLMLLLL
jgi:predicted phosphodiesterase